MKYLLVFIMTLVSNAVCASSIDNVTITKIAINHSSGNYVFIKLDRAPDRITCSTNGGWDYTLSLNDEGYKNMYAMMLSAFMAGHKVDIKGLAVPACNEFPAIESLNSIYITK